MPVLHFIYSCEKIKKFPVGAPWDEVNRLNLCTNCPRNNHCAPDCTAQGCKVCSNLHNTMLHIQANTLSVGSDITTVACATSNSDHIYQILLSTALVLVKGANKSMVSL